LPVLESTDKAEISTALRKLKPKLELTYYKKNIFFSRGQKSMIKKNLPEL
jgi:hypothetical protein